MVPQSQEIAVIASLVGFECVCAPARGSIVRLRQGHGMPFLACLILLAMMLRAQNINSRSLWFDEAFSWRLCQFPLGEFAQRGALDCHPLLFPVLLKGWSVVFGCSTAALRSFSVICGVATVLGTYLYCHEALRAGDNQAGVSDGSRTALLAASLVAVSVFQVRWSWDVKMNALGAMLSVFSSWALLRAIRLGRLWDWLTYGALALAFVHTHYYALFSVFAQAGFAALFFLRSSSSSAARALREASCRRWLFAVAFIFIGFAPWLPIFIRQHNRDRAVAGRRPITIARVSRAPFSMFIEPEPEVAKVSDAAAFGVFVLSEALLLAVLVRPTMGTCYTFLAATAPWAMGIATSLVDTAVFEVRYLTFSQPFWLVAAAIAVSRIPSTAWRRCAAAMLIGAMLVAHVRFYRICDFTHRPGARAVAEFLDRNRREGEPVVVCSQNYYYPILYHLSNTRGMWLYDDEDTVRLHLWGSAIIQPHELLSRKELESIESSRVWVVDMEGGWGSLRVPFVPGWHRKSQKRFGGTWGFEGDYIVVEYEIARKSVVRLD